MQRKRPISSAITERIVNYIQMSVTLLFSVCIWLKKARVYIMNADYADLVILNGDVYERQEV